MASANIVGYNTIEVESGKWYLLAPQFEDVSNAGQATIDLLKTLKATGLVAQTYANRASASQIQVYNPQTMGYSYWYYCKSGSGDAAVSQWRSSPAVPASFPVNVGCGIWLRVGDVESTGATITFNGQVKTADSFTINVGGDNGEWNIIANPYPVPLTLNMLTTAGLTAQTYANRVNASQIQVYNPATEGYTYWYYCKSGSGDAAVSQWRSSPGVPAETTQVVGVGGAFWIKAKEAGTLTFTLNK